ncbi:hypothetical protein ACI2KR_06725 [Pseudomonas luteola]
MDLEARRQMEQRITIAAAEGLVAAGCTVSVIEGDTVHLSESTDPLAIDSALHLSGEPGFYVKREIKGRIVEAGWISSVMAALRLLLMSALILQKHCNPQTVWHLNCKV